MSLASPFLHKGMILAILKSLITLLVERERLNICESAMIILSFLWLVQPVVVLVFI